MELGGLSSEEQNSVPTVISGEPGGLQGLQSCKTQNTAAVESNKELGGLQDLQSCAQQNGAAGATHWKISGLQGLQGCRQQNGATDVMKWELGGLQGFRSSDDEMKFKEPAFELGQSKLPASPELELVLVLVPMQKDAPEVVDRTYFRCQHWLWHNQGKSNCHEEFPEGQGSDTLVIGYSVRMAISSAPHITVTSVTSRTHTLHHRHNY